MRNTKRKQERRDGKLKSNGSERGARTADSGMHSNLDLSIYYLCDLGQINLSEPVFPYLFNILHCMSRDLMKRHVLKSTA